MSTAFAQSEFARFIGAVQKLKRLAAAKATLKNRGWTYRGAAPVLGVTYQHLCYVLTGHRQSHRLLTAIATLPRCNQGGAK